MGKENRMVGTRKPQKTKYIIWLLVSGLPDRPVVLDFEMEPFWVFRFWTFYSGVIYKQKYINPKRTAWLIFL